MVTIRQFQPEDTFTVIKLAYETLPERYNPTTFNNLYESFPEGFIIAEQYHKIIGFIAGTKTFEHAKIMLLTVSENYRRKKIATNLINKFYENLKKINVPNIELSVKTDNTAAITFYKKQGFIIIEKIGNFYQDGSNAYIMKKKL